MNKRNMERDNNWVLCPSKSFPGKFYYFNVLTGEAAWTLSEIENARPLQKNSYIQKVNKWHTYPEPDSPPGDRFALEPGWQRKPDQYLFSRPTMPVFGQPAFSLYQSQYLEPQLPNMMQNPIPMDPVFMRDVKRQPDFQNMWGCGRDSYFSNTNKTKRFGQYEKPVFNGNRTSTPIKSQWPYNYQEKDAIPIFGQNLHKPTPNVFEPRTNVIKEPVFGRQGTQSDSSTFENENNLFRTKCTQNLFTTKTSDYLKSLDDSAYFDQTKPSRKFNTQFTPKSSVFQTGRIFGTKSYENLQTLDDSGCFEMSKIKRADQKNIFLTQPDRNIRLTRHISSKNVSSSNNLKSSLNSSPRKRTQSVLSGQEKEGEINGGKMDGDNDLHQNLSEDDLRYILTNKRKKLDNPQVGTGTKVKTSYSNRNVTAAAKKRVTFDIDIESEENGENDLAEDKPDGDGVYEKEPVHEEFPIEPVKFLKSLDNAQSKTDAWYIVVDTEILLEDFEFITTFVQADTKCRLLIPIAIRHQLDAITVGDCRGRQRVIAARQLARKIASPPEYIAVQVAEEYTSDTSVSESILNCCLQAIDQKYHVVLITNDATLFKKSNSLEIPCVTLQEIKDSASAPKPELSFDIRKVINQDKDNSNGRNNQCITVSSTVNPFSLSSGREIPVNCFRKRLFDEQNFEINVDHGLFFQNDDRNVIDETYETSKTNHATKRSAACENFQLSDVFAPKNYRDNKDLSDTSANTSEIRHIQENIQSLIIEDMPTNIIIQKKAKPENLKDRTNVSEEILEVHKDGAKSEVHTVKRKELKSINGYTIDQHLKKFDIKSKFVEDRVKTRMDEWICSLSQIMEDVLTYILQDYSGTQRALTPPWSFAEAVECVRDMYGDHSSVKIIVEKLSALLFNCSCKRGKLNLNMKPKDFMTIFGLGILLIQCLKNVVPTQCELCKAEEALLSLLELVTEPGVEPAPPEPVPAPSVCTSAEVIERKNCESNSFVKKPSEVIEYLRRHYPEWKTYKETKDDTGLHHDIDQAKTLQLKEKGKQIQKIVRTVGKDLNNLKIDNDKAINFTQTNDRKNSTKKDEHFDCNDAQKVIKAKSNDAKFDDIETEGACDETIKTTGAKLLRKLAINSLHKPPTLKYIDVEKRDKSGKELMSMIDSMIGNTNKDATNPKIIDDNDRNNNTNQVHNENMTVADKESKFLRTFGNFTIRKVKTQYNDDEDKTTSKYDEPKEIRNNSKYQSPKIIRNFNLVQPVKDKVDKSRETLDLDALDYDMDPSEDKNSLITKVNDNNDAAQMVDNDSSSKNNPLKQADDDSPQNEDEHNNENIETDTTNDSGFENDSLQAYSLAKTCLTEISVTLKKVYSFISQTASKFRAGRVDGGAKMTLYRKTNDSCNILADIIDNLKRIIERESNDRMSMRTALIKSGIFHAISDKRIVRYKQVMRKYLEQARLLEEALRVVLTATSPAPDEAEGTVSTLSSDIKYINIFE